METYCKTVYIQPVHTGWWLRGCLTSDRGGAAQKLCPRNCCNNAPRLSHRVERLTLVKQVTTVDCGEVCSAITLISLTHLSFTHSPRKGFQIDAHLLLHYRLVLKTFRSYFWTRMKKNMAVLLWIYVSIAYLKFWHHQHSILNLIIANHNIFYFELCNFA